MASTDGGVGVRKLRAPELDGGNGGSSVFIAANAIAIACLDSAGVAKILQVWLV